jgi:hypothetical protein
MSISGLYILHQACQALFWKLLLTRFRSLQALSMIFAGVPRFILSGTNRVHLSLGVTDRLTQFRLRYGLAHLEFFRDSQFLADNRSAEAAPSARGRRRRVRGNNIEVHFENVCDVQGLEATARNSVGSLPISHPK